MKKPFIAIFTETPNSGNSGSDTVTAVTAALLVVFANRDAQTLDDVEGTKINLEGQGEGVHVREFDFLREIPDLWDLSPSPARVGDVPSRGSAARRADEGSGETPIISAEADKIIAERASSASVPPASSTGVSPVVPDVGSDAAKTRSAGLRPGSLGAPNNPAIQPSINPEAVAAIHQCLKLLAGHCDGARTIDGAGFNKMDAEFGHSLANAHALSPKQAVHGQKLIRKYHRQLPADLLQAALGTDDPLPTGNCPSPTGAGDVPSRGLAARRPDEGCGENPIIDDGIPIATRGDGPLSTLHSPVPDIGPDAVSVRTPAQLINHKYTKLVKPGVYQPKSGDEVAGNGCEEYYGDTYQNGVKPGPKKLAQFREILELTGTPKLYGQEGKGDEALVHVKLFDPTGSWTWFITEFDPGENTAFGLVNGHEAEVGYIDLNELATARGRLGIGIEIDMHFKPQTLAACRETIHA